MFLPYTSRTKLFLLLQFFFSNVWHINLHTFDISCICLKRTEKQHEILWGDVHPIVIAKRQSFGHLHVLTFNHMLWFIIPNIIDVFLFQISKILKLRWLLVVILHPLPYSTLLTLNWSLLTYYFLILFDLLWFLIFHVVILLQFIICLIGIYLATVSINCWSNIKRRIVHHFAESFIDFNFSHLCTRSQELRIIGSLGKPIIDLLIFFNYFFTFCLLMLLLSCNLLDFLCFRTRFLRFLLGHRMLNVILLLTIIAKCKHK